MDLGTDLIEVDLVPQVSVGDMADIYGSEE